jgi:error-prone DNA polymerase
MRKRLALSGTLPAERINQDARDGQAAVAAGVVLARQRPGSAKGVIFMTLEDETGVVNVVVWPRTTEAFRRVVMTSRLAWVRGRIQRTGKIVHLVADRLEDITGWLSQLSENGDAIHQKHGPYAAGPPLAHHPRNQRVIPRSRDFH